MKKYIIPMMICAFVFDAQAAVKIKNSTAERYEEQIANANGEEFVTDDEAADIATLENDIAILDEEIAKCKKQKKGWIAATVIGTAGTVATGVAAAVQGAKISEKKNISAEKRREVEAKDRELQELQRQTQDSK